MKKTRKWISLLCAMVMVFTMLAVPAGAESIDGADGEEIIATTTIIVATNLEDGSVEVIEGDIPAPCDSSADFHWQYYATYTATLYTTGTVGSYGVRLTGNTFNGFLISRIIFSIRPNDIGAWTKLDKSYSDARTSISESLDFNYTGDSRDMVVEVRLSNYIKTGAILDTWCNFTDASLDLMHKGN